MAEVKLAIPEVCLVVLVGVSGSGKSSFARKHFRATEVLSSDTCRGLVSDDENNLAATKDAFEVLHFIARKRLACLPLHVGRVHHHETSRGEPLAGDEVQHVEGVRRRGLVGLVVGDESPAEV